MPDTITITDPLLTERLPDNSDEPSRDFADEDRQDEFYARYYAGESIEQIRERGWKSRA